MDPTQVGCRLHSFFNSVWGMVFFLVNAIVNLQNLYKAGNFFISCMIIDF